LLALHELRAFDRDTRKSAPEIAFAATGSHSKSSTRDRLQELHDLDLVRTVRGVKGGSYLTPAGKHRAERELSA
jgi:DNA-binding IscR family transcriptional regulator